MQWLDFVLSSDKRFVIKLTNAQEIEHLTHDLKNPLQIILSTSQLLQNMLASLRIIADDKLSQASEVLLMQQRNIYRLLRMIENMLAIQRTENDLCQANVELVDINECLQTVVNECSSAFNDVKFETKIASKPIMIDTDVLILQRVLLNLITNAVKACRVKRTNNIKIVIENSSDNLTIIVEDNGCGIDGEDLDKIGDKYFKPNKHKELQEGAGLGVYLSKQLLSKINASLQYTSKIDVGTKVQIILPKINVENNAVRQVKSTSQTYQSNETDLLYKMELLSLQPAKKL